MVHTAAVQLNTTTGPSVKGRSCIAKLCSRVVPLPRISDSDATARDSLPAELEPSLFDAVEVSDFVAGRNLQLWDESAVLNVPPKLFVVMYNISYLSGIPLVKQKNPSYQSQHNKVESRLEQSEHLVTHN